MEGVAQSLYFEQHKKTNTHGTDIETETSKVIDNNTQQIDSHHNNT